MTMLLRTKLFGKTYEFGDIRELMGKANEPKSGDELAGVAATSVASSSPNGFRNSRSSESAIPR